MESQSPLPPIKTGRETPLTDDDRNLLLSPTSLDSFHDEKENIINDSLLGSKETLPPIPGNKHENEIKLHEKNLPKVLSFKREFSNGASGIATSTERLPSATSNERDSESRGSKSVSFAEIESIKKINHNDFSESFAMITGKDGNEHVVRSIEIQTDWTILNEQDSTKKDENEKINNDYDIDDEDFEKVNYEREESAKSQNLIDNQNIDDSVSWPHRQDDEFGIPVLTIDDSDSFSDDSFELDLDMEKKLSKQKYSVNTLPSVGPPEVLKYKRENVKLEKIKESEFDSVDFEEFNKKVGGGMFSGNCEFCSNEIKPPPTLDEQRNTSPEKLYCCQDYRDFVHYAANHPLLEKKKVEKSKISLKPHAPHGSKEAREAAKERAALRMRERELARQQAAMAITRGETTTSGPANSFLQYGRQQCTINYQLSSEKCFEKGWTLRPPSPLETTDEDVEIWEPDLDWYEKNTRPVGTLKKFYKNGQEFALLFADGSGHIKYPNGQTAITRIRLDEGLFSYILHSHEKDYPLVLGYFEPNGYGSTNFLSGKLRLYLSPVGGLEVDEKGRKKRKWFWKVQPEHVHAPPIQPITFSISDFLSLRIRNQDKISITFRCEECNCRFQVGSKITCTMPEKVHMNDMENLLRVKKQSVKKINELLTAMGNIMRLPKSPRLALKSTGFCDQKKVKRLPTVVTN